jgi:alpha-L-fucosidase
MKSLSELIRTLVDCVGGDGNLLLNVGPMPNGEIEPRQAKRLRELGRWLKANGRSLYGTRGGPFPPGPWGVSTHQGSSIFLHVLDWPEDNRLVLPAPQGEIRSARTLQGRPVHYFQSSESLDVLRPPNTDEEIDTIVELVMKIPASSP